jgi:hypothetical protein
MGLERFRGTFEVSSLSHLNVYSYHLLHFPFLVQAYPSIVVETTQVSPILTLE